MNDATGSLLAQNAPYLKALHLASTDVTGVFVKELVTRHLSPPMEIGPLLDETVINYKSQLKHLCFNQCKNMNVDAVDWARSQGMSVAFSFSEDKAGRKVRST